MSSAESDLEACRSMLKHLGWSWAADQLHELLEQAVSEDRSFASFLQLIAEQEHNRREERRVTNWLKRSGLPRGQTLENFDFTFAQGVDKAKIDLLATCEFIAKRETALLLGPSGTGKSHLAAALGVKAIQNGFPTYFIEADDLIEMLRRDDDRPRHQVRRRRYMTATLLIIDEFGFQPLDQADAHRLFRLIHDRHERVSTIITSNKSVRQWPGLLAEDELLATALLDRLLHHCHLLQIDGPSYRLRHLQDTFETGQAAAAPRQ